MVPQNKPNQPMHCMCINPHKFKSSEKTTFVLREFSCEMNIQQTIKPPCCFAGGRVYSKALANQVYYHYLKEIIRLSINLVNAQESHHYYMGFLW